jgi:hypothetical protein
MLSQSSVDPNITSESQSAIPRPPVFSEEDVQAIMDVITKASGQGSNSSTGHPPTPIAFDAGEDFLTSPMESPFDDFLSTPLQRMGDFDNHDLTSPLIVDDNSAFDSSALFYNSSFFEPHCEKRHNSESSSLSTISDGLYMISPVTPALEPSSITRTTFPLPTTRSQTVPNGTRKNVTPESLIPLDAPVQPRRYLSASATSRKDDSTRKRAHSQAFGDDENEGDASKEVELDGIAAKRLQNTLAARRSRKRKLEYQQELEVAVERERVASERWKARALTLEALLTSHGIPVPPSTNF